VSRKRSKMIKSLAAVACVAASAPTFAQSSVTLYGVLDTFVGAVKAPGGHTAVSLNGAADGGMTSSFFGIAGKEDLGGGYSTFFVLESYVQPANGTYGRFSGDSFFSRNAYVGISTPYGSFRAGHLTTQLYFATIQFNPFGNSYTFSPIIYQTYKGLGTQGVVGDSVWNNAVAYTSSDFGGFSGGAMYSFGGAAGSAGAHKWGTQLSLVQGPLAATAVYQYINYSSAPGDIGTALAEVPGLQSQSTAELAMTYDFKIVKIYGQYMNITDQASTGNFHSNTGQLGVSVPVGVGHALGSYAYSKTDGAFEDRRGTLAVGYDYPLSKRTDIYAAFKFDHVANESSGITYGGGLRTSF